MEMKEKAKATIWKPLYNAPLWRGAHRFQLGQRFAEWFMASRRGAFLEGFKQEMRFPVVSGPKAFPRDYEKEELVALVLHHRDARIEISTKLSETLEKLAAAERTLGRRGGRNK